jgi:hypothetical protein
LNGWLKTRWLVWGLAATVLLSGCSSVLKESKESGGKVERIRIDTGESWDRYDIHPRDPYSKRNTYDEKSIMLLKEMTF